MSGHGSAVSWELPAAVFTLSAAVTWASIRYAHRRQLFDLPGQRRSHTSPTPRGGGIGIVVAALFACALVATLDPTAPVLPMVVAILLVAAVGWADDHRGLSARTRLIAHFAAAIVLALPLLSPTAHIGDAGIHMAVFFGLCAFVVIACAWSINLHNFMDGINGLLALQAIFVFCAMAWCDREGFGASRTTMLILWAAATAGFVPFNFPRARIFMGDVGSGVLGLLVGAAVIWQATTHASALATGVIACSAFVTDATCTLLSRMLRGRRWYSAHREHLYQWLVRSGLSHAKVVALYMAWNLCIAAPVLYWVNRNGRALDASGVMATSMDVGVAPAVAIYALAVVAWFAGKRWCLKKIQNAITQPE